MIPDVFEEKCELKLARAFEIHAFILQVSHSFCRYLRLYVRHESKVEAAKKAWDNFLIREHFVDFSVESSQSQLLKASPARSLKTGRPPVAPTISSSRQELFPSKDEGTKKKAKVDLVKSGDMKLTAFFASK
jgi:hypothetical protein